MYHALDVVGLAIAEAESADGPVMCDRRRYLPFLEAAELYAHKHQMVVGGNTATKLQLREPFGPHDETYEVFSTQPLDDARALTKIFYDMDPGGLGHYANMATTAPHKDFTISVDERRLVRVRQLDGRCVATETCPALFSEGTPLLCMGPEIQLVSIYASLCDPSRSAEWPALIRTEERLRARLVAEPAPVAGGGESFTTAALVRALAAEYVPLEGHVAVGSGAVAAWAPGAGRASRLQVVSANGFLEEETAVRVIASRLGFRIQSCTDDPKFPTDERLRRMTVYAVRPGEGREPILTVYSSGQYELVPFAAGAVAAAPKTGGKSRPKKNRQKDGRQSEKDDGRRSEKGGRRSEKGGRRSEKEGRRKEKDGRRSEKGGRRSEKEGRRKEKDGRRSEKEGRRSEKGGRRSEKEGRRKEKDGRRSEKGGRRSAAWTECVAPTYIASDTELPGDAPVGTPFVLMRFLLIEMWTARARMRAQRLSKSAGECEIQALMADFTRVAGVYTALRDAGSFARLVPTAGAAYAGVYTNAMI
jgi:hypothetical protein